jgi:hypothetical protein
MRLAEIALFAAPFAVFLLWRLLSPTGGPSRLLILCVTLGVAAMAGTLFFLRVEDTAPPGSDYIPARQVDGRIVPGHLVPPGSDNAREAGGMPANGQAKGPAGAPDEARR